MSEGLPRRTGPFCVTPEASAGIREWSCTGQWFSLERKIESACHVRCKELASWERMSCKLPIPAGAGTEAVLLLSVWLLEVLDVEEALAQGLLPALTCKMSLL